MWLQIRPTLYAGALVCVLHICLLGIAASVVVTLPHYAAPHLHVTLLQRAIPLPIQELSGAAQTSEPAPAPKTVARETSRSMPPAARSTTEKKLIRAASPPPAKPKVKPRFMPPAPAKEEPAQTALVVPPVQPESFPVTEPSSASETAPSIANEDSPGGEYLGHNTRLATAEGRTRNAAGTTGAGRPSASPDYNVNPKPPYPLIARRIGAQGEVVLRVLVRQDGSVANVEIAHSSGFSLLDDSATRTVRDSWRFIPAQLDGTPVDSWVEVPIKFVLADS